MNKTRLEAFSDGVIAIIITIMVLELEAPHGATFADILPLLPVFLSYILSFLYVGIYWNNHHHMLHTVHTVSGPILWDNLYLLLWISLIQFATAWVGVNNFAALPTAAYGVVLLMSAIAYYVMQNVIIAVQGPNSLLAKAVGKDIKGKLSLALYLIAIFTTGISVWIAQGIYFFVAMMWLIPDTRIEKTLENIAD